jgi:hypothetical protein
VYNYKYQRTQRETGVSSGYPTTGNTHDIHGGRTRLVEHTKEQEEEGQQSDGDGRAPAKKDMRKHDWAITTTIEVDGVSYVMPVQV